MDEQLRVSSHWIFDMDGTLTVAVHDFDAIRAELGLPHGRPILEALEELPRGQAEGLLARLDAIEHALVDLARPGEGAAALLDALARRGARLGVLTRNSVPIAHRTLAACGLDGYFDPECVLGRESAPPKPRPDGVLRLLERWGARPEQSVMVGDYLFDLVAGRAAGTRTVYVDRSGRGEWAEHADLIVPDLDALAALLA